MMAHKFLHIVLAARMEENLRKMLTGNYLKVLLLEHSKPPFLGESGFGMREVSLLSEDRRRRG